MDRACDGGGCHSEKSDWQEEKEKKKTLKTKQPQTSE